MNKPRSLRDAWVAQRKQATVAVRHYYQGIDGWFDFDDLYKRMVNQTESGVFVEVGSWHGKSAAYMGVEIINSRKNIRLYCVDVWDGVVDGYDLGAGYPIFLSNIKMLGEVVVPIRQASVEAAKTFQDASVDFCFIDASHRYEDVLNDIRAWLPKVKKGGILAGHDYSDDWTGVVRAVDELLPQRMLVSKRCWEVRV